jgi:energy-converting hydrogenase B subunit I
VVDVDVRKNVMAAAFAAVGLFILAALASLTVAPGVNDYYNRYGHKIAPNMVTLIVFDFRGYDTLGECVILVVGVLAVSMLYGRGLLGGDVHEEDFPDTPGTPVLRMFGPFVLSITLAMGVYVALGGHITPGGGFQGGSIVAAGVLLTLVTFGRKAVDISHSALVRMESAGVMLYILLGLAGLAYSGYFLYNAGATFTDGRAAAAVPAAAQAALAYPDGLNAGILPYLNVSVLVKVSAGLTTVALVLLGGKR